MTTRTRTGIALAVAAALAACGGDGTLESGVLNVYAASSLTDAFGELETVFERAHPGVDVAITFAGSQVLRLQIEQGAPADVFASANVEHMDALLDADLVEESRVFAHNDLVVIVPPDNPAGITELGDLGHAQRLVLGTANVPVGQYAREILRRAAPTYEEGFEAIVMSRVVSEESNVRLARAKVELGEADASIVYRTDAGSSDRVRIVEIPRALNVIADYPIAVVRGTRAREAADAFVALVGSPEGRAVLERHGFLVE
ncbi:MAG: molybdate ABC transporter substrate-binding protein [Gemmatimonadales bacterium]